MTQENTNNPRPGMEDLLIETNAGYNFNPVEEMLRSKPDAQDFLARGRLPTTKVKSYFRLMAQMQFVKNGVHDVLELMGLDSSLSIGENGMGRKDAIGMITGRRPMNLMEKQREVGSKKLDA